jgi:hypothetical protein
MLKLTLLGCQLTHGRVGGYLGGFRARFKELSA